MLDRQYNQIIFECDGEKCNEFLETETKDFADALTILNDSKWKARREGKEWLHICFTCLETENSNPFSRGFVNHKK